MNLKGFLMMGMALASFQLAAQPDAESLCGWSTLKLQWKKCTITHGSEKIEAEQLRFEPPKDKIMTVPVLVPMPDRGEIMLVFHSGYPASTPDSIRIHYAMKTVSRDGGNTWSKAELLNSGEETFGITTEVCCLGNSTLLASPRFRDDPKWRYRSTDGGNTWKRFSEISGTEDCKAHFGWDPPLVHQGKIYETAYTAENNAYYRVSRDGGLTFGKNIVPPQWKGCNEVRLQILPDGTFLAGIRGHNRNGATDQSDRLLVSRSPDGINWSEPEEIASVGRMHPSFALLPDGRIVLSYVVREGYPDSPEGAPRYGIEAVISRDGGKTWDKEHPYILAIFTADHLRGSERWASSVQSTESLVLPDGRILIAFGDAHRAAFNAKRQQMPRDIQMIRWKP